MKPNNKNEEKGPTQPWLGHLRLRLTEAQPLADFCDGGTLVFTEKDGK